MVAVVFVGSKVVSFVSLLTLLGVSVVLELSTKSATSCSSPKIKGEKKA